MEDDLLITDTDFLPRFCIYIKCVGQKYVFLPHRCEHIPGRDVILSEILTVEARSFLGHW